MIDGHRVTFVVAVDQEFGMGKNGTLPWRLPKELAHFHRVTTETHDPAKKNMVIMGRGTWESIPPQRRPLPHRKNVILTRSADFEAMGASLAASFDDAFALADGTIEAIHIIGGGQVFAQAINLPELDEMFITRIDASYGCDTFFPAIPQKFHAEEIGHEEEKGTRFTYYRYSLQ